MSEWLVGNWLPPARIGQFEIRRDNENTVLVEDGFWWMSDRDDDLLQEKELRPRGRVLITGLGLGVVPARWAELAEVERIDVLELSEDLIGYVGTKLADRSDKIKVINGDAWNPPPLGHYDFAYHDFLREPASAEQRAAIVVLYDCQNQCFWQGMTWQTRAG